jgi:uncharacterized protein with FMN-binding domain
MKRTGIVLLATAAGLAAVLGFHTRPASLSLGSPPVTVPRASPPSSASRPPTSSGTGNSPPTSTPTTGTRTATGVAVNYNYGILSVVVTVSGTKLTNVAIAAIDDGGNFRSQSIDQQSIPVLEQQALAAQSANIQGVSGASYTSAGFQQSLQSALTKLGFK